MRVYDWSTLGSIHCREAKEGAEHVNKAGSTPRIGNIQCGGASTILATRHTHWGPPRGCTPRTSASVQLTSQDPACRLPRRLLLVLPSLTEHPAQQAGLPRQEHGLPSRPQ